MEHARDYRSNYTALHKLEMQLENESITPEKVEEIRLKYCDLLDTAWNHVQYDYYCTVYQSTGEYQKKRWKVKVVAGFFWGKVWRAMVMMALLIIPIAVYFLCGVM
jgi:hypothetical protein